MRLAVLIVGLLLVSGCAEDVMVGKRIDRSRQPSMQEAGRVNVTSAPNVTINEGGMVSGPVSETVAQIQEQSSGELRASRRLTGVRRRRSNERESASGNRDEVQVIPSFQSGTTAQEVSLANSPSPTSS